MEPKKNALILKITDGTVDEVTDEIAAELPVRLVMNNEPFVTLLCTPTDLEELAVGFLLSEGIVRKKSSIKKLIVDEGDAVVTIELSDLPDNWQRMFEKKTISSGCGRGITFTNHGKELDTRVKTKGPVMTLEGIRKLLRDFRNISSLYLSTGGVHSAGLSDGKSILFFAEDIGRHNAVDKLIGRAFLQSVSIRDKILLTSGRVTSEIITKAGRNGFPILISRAAPSCMSISYAEDMGITLIGFARGNRMNIYTWPNRITM